MELSPGGEPLDKKPILTADGLIQTSGPGTIGAEQATSNIGSSITGGTQQNNLTVDQLDIVILPVIYEIIRGIEKDPLDNTTKQRESAECSQKILELHKRFESARGQIKLLPGIDYNKDEQLQKLEILRNQLKLKQQLIQKYKDTKF